MLKLREPDQHIKGENTFGQSCRAIGRIVRKCLIRPSPKETSSLHQHERSRQADATTIDGVRTVYSHAHSIITSSNARAGERLKIVNPRDFCQGVREKSAKILCDYLL